MATTFTDFSVTLLARNWDGNITVDSTDPLGVADAPVPAGEFLIAAYHFNDGDLKSTSTNGVSWASGTGTYTAPSGETEAGLLFSFPADPDPTEDSWVEERFSFGEQDTIYVYERFFIPANYFHRRISVLTVDGDISTWQAGDAVVGTDGTTASTIYSIVGTTVYMLLSENPGSDAIWTGSITNTTRSQSRTSTRQPSESDNNKVFAIWCDGYSAAGQSPSVVWEMRSNGTGGSNFYYHFSGDGSVTGVPVNSNSPEVPFIGDDDLGTWMELIFRVTHASSESAEDGIIETWLKRDGESVFTRVHNQTNALLGPRAAASGARWQDGYLWGWCNSGYTEQTDIYVSEFEIHNGLPPQLAS